MSKPKRRRFSFVQVLMVVTAATHATFSLAAIEFFRRVGAPLPGLCGLGLSLALLGAFFLRLRLLFPDRPRSRWALHLIEEPYFAHWCAALGAFPVILLGLLKAGLMSALGRGAELPTTWALVTYGITLTLALWGVFIRRRWVLTRELEVVVPGLPREFDGYRVAQLSDLHIGGFTPRRWGEAWARRSNAAAPDLVVVTGDMVSSGVDFHADIAHVIGALRAEDGIYVSMGNHDYFGDGEPLVSLLRAQGAVVLRNQGRTVTRGDASLFVAGVDDTWTRRADLALTLSDRAPGACTVLLAHDPDLFPAAAEHGANLVLSGHTHGGQVALPFFSEMGKPRKARPSFSFGALPRRGCDPLRAPGARHYGPPHTPRRRPRGSCLHLAPGVNPSLRLKRASSSARIVSFKSASSSARRPSARARRAPGLRLSRAPVWPEKRRAR